LFFVVTLGKEREKCPVVMSSRSVEENAFEEDGCCGKRGGGGDQDKNVR
jgi:hypothetical protein